MSSDLSLGHARIRLSWMKIYRVFYFYYTPIITFVKIKKNCEDPSRKEFKLSPEALNEVRDNMIDFIPDINWFSVYDSSNKEHKSIMKRLKETKKRRKPEEIILEDKNIITKYIKENPGKDGWE